MDSVSIPVEMERTSGSIDPDSIAALRILFSSSARCSGSRIATDCWFANLVRDCRIQNLAYVTNLFPVEGSYFSAARMSPMFASEMRSSYSMAGCLAWNSPTVFRRNLWLCIMRVFLASISPLSALAPRSVSSCAVRILCPRACVR